MVAALGSTRWNLEGLGQVYRSVYDASAFRWAQTVFCMYSRPTACTAFYEAEFGGKIGRSTKGGLEPAHYCRSKNEAFSWHVVTLEVGS